jgi:hypothetical protein
MKENIKKILPPTEKAFKGKQLNLFQHFLCNTQDEQDQLSNTINLWDAVPKYYINRRRQSKLRKDGFLPTAERDFIFKGQQIKVKVRPARITVEGQDKEFYPAAREELVEDALRKLACNLGNGYLDNNRSGVSFTLHQLRQELKKRGHTLSYYEVVEALRILAATTIEILSSDGKTDYTATPLTNLIRVSESDLRDDPAARWYADFSILVTEGIKKELYRQFNYVLMMSMKSQLARYLHKRLSHNYIQASLLKPYTITMIGISRDSGLLECTRNNDNKKILEKALEELKLNKIIMYYESDIIRGSRNSLKDIKYKLFPHQEFTTEIKRANKRLMLTERR